MNKCLAICFCFIPLSFSSCVKDVTLDAKEKPRVAVVCILNDEDPVQKLRLSFTKGVSLSSAPLLTEASAILYEDNEFVGEFQRAENNDWRLEFTPKPCLSYRLEIDVPGYDKITATQSMPMERAAVRSVKYTLFQNVIEPWSGWDIRWDDLHDMGYESWPESEEYPDEEYLYVLFSTKSPVWVYAMNYNTATGKRELAEKICTDSYPVSNENAYDAVYVPLTLEAPNPPYKLSHPYEQKYGETYHSAHTMELYPTLSNKPLHDYFLRFTEETADVFYLSGSFNGKYCKTQDGIWAEAGEIAEDEGFLVFSTVSEDLDKYLLEAYKQIKINGSTDFSSIYIRDNLYSNISGGIGIFGACISRKYPWAAAYSYIDSGIPRSEIIEDVDGYIDPRKMY